MMPIVAPSSYQPPVWLPGGHSQTVFPTLLRRLTPPILTRTRISTPDGDFLDLDSSPCGHATRKLILLSHGLEGNSRRKYILGMGKAFMREGFDMLAWNHRFCSDEPNLKPRLYHSGDTEDLHTVILHAITLGYSFIILVGFSMGGNQILKYLGENPARVPHEVQGAIAYSTPCDLTGSAQILANPRNKIYMANFLITLRKKIRVKHQTMPEYFDITGLNRVKTFREFDNRYTAPLHGFASAEDYWDKSSCLHFLPAIQKPALLVNALNDPFMSPGCYPKKLALQHSCLYLETPPAGGHVGFTPAHPPAPGQYWSEYRAVRFAREIIGIM